MQAILIDPYSETIVAVDYDGDFRSIYSYIDATMYDVVTLPNRDGIFVDDEGLLTMTPKTKFIVIEGIAPLAGKALVIGADEEGRSVDAKTTVEEFKAITRFLHLGL